MNPNFSMAINVATLKSLVGFNGNTDLGKASVTQAENEGFCLRVSSMFMDRPATVKFELSERGRLLRSEVERYASSNIVTGSDAVGITNNRELFPFSVSELIAAVQASKAA